MLTIVTLTKNEETILPYFFRHYQDVADLFVVYDNQSTDRTREIIKAQPKAWLRDYDTHGEMNDLIHKEIKNEAYKTLPGDWFIVVDADEFLYSEEGLKTTLEGYYKRDDIVVPKVHGYSMAGHGVPVDDGKTQLTELIRDGALDGYYDKNCIFHKSVDIRYFIGAHWCTPEWRAGFVSEQTLSDTPVYFSASPLKLLHYKWLSLDYAMKRMAATAKTLSKINRDEGWGSQVLMTDKLEEWYRTEIVGKAERVVK